MSGFFSVEWFKKLFSVHKLSLLTHRLHQTDFGHWADQAAQHTLHRFVGNRIAIRSELSAQRQMRLKGARFQHKPPPLSAAYSPVSEAHSSGCLFHACPNQITECPYTLKLQLQSCFLYLVHSAHPLHADLVSAQEMPASNAGFSLL